MAQSEWHMRGVLFNTYVLGSLRSNKMSESLSMYTGACSPSLLAYDGLSRVLVLQNPRRTFPQSKSVRSRIQLGYGELKQTAVPAILATVEAVAKPMPTSCTRYNWFAIPLHIYHCQSAFSKNVCRKSFTSSRSRDL